MGWVYLIRNGDLHKIGRTDNLERRMKELKPDEVVEAVATHDCHALELRLHRRFKAKRLPQTEYFRLDEPEVNAVRMALGWKPGSPVALPPTELDIRIADAGRRILWAMAAVAVAALGVGVDALSSHPLALLVGAAGYLALPFALLGVLWLVVVCCWLLAWRLIKGRRAARA